MQTFTFEVSEQITAYTDPRPVTIEAKDAAEARALLLAAFDGGEDPGSAIGYWPTSDIVDIESTNRYEFSGETIPYGISVTA